MTFTPTRADLYLSATVRRILADKTGDPEDYRKAAAEFRALGMWLAAERCEEKARYVEIQRSS